MDNYFLAAKKSTTKWTQKYSCVLLGPTDAKNATKFAKICDPR